MCYSNFYNNNKPRIQGIFLFTFVESKPKKKNVTPLY